MQVENVSKKLTDELNTVAVAVAAAAAADTVKTAVVALLALIIHFNYDDKCEQVPYLYL